MKSPTGSARRPALSALLSAVFPGLGQFYNRDWLKGAGFFSATVVLMGFAGGSISVEALLSAGAVDLRPVLGSVILLAVLALWSVVDAYRRARG